MCWTKTISGPRMGGGHVRPPLPSKGLTIRMHTTGPVGNIETCKTQRKGQRGVRADAIDETKEKGLEKGRPLARRRTQWTSRRPRSAAKTSRSYRTLALTSSTVNGIQMRYSFINTIVRPVIAAVVVDDTMTVPAIALQRTHGAATVERSCSCCYGGRRRSRCCCFSYSCGDRTGQAEEFVGIRTG